MHGASPLSPRAGSRHTGRSVRANSASSAMPRAANAAAPALAAVDQAEHARDLAALRLDGVERVQRRGAGRDGVLEQRDALARREAALDAAAEAVRLLLLAHEEAGQRASRDRAPAAAASTAATSGTAPTAIPPTASTAGPRRRRSSTSAPASSTPRGRISVWRRSR